MIIDPADPNFDAEKAYFDFKGFLLRENKIACLTYFSDRDVNYWLLRSFKQPDINDNTFKDFLIVWELTGFIKRAQPAPVCHNLKSWWEGLR